MEYLAQRVVALWQAVDPAIRARALVMGVLASVYIWVLARRQLQQRRTPDPDPAVIEIRRWERRVMVYLVGIFATLACLLVVGALGAPDAVIVAGLGPILVLGVLAIRANWMVGRLTRRMGGSR